MKLLTVYIPEGLIDSLDQLVDKDFYPHRAEAIRIGIRLLVQEHGNLKVPILIPDFVGVREIQNLFRQFFTEKRTICPFHCPHHQDCYVDPGCFKRVLTDFVFWLKEKAHKEA